MLMLSYSDLEVFEQHQKLLSCGRTVNRLDGTHEKVRKLKHRRNTHERQDIDH